ncbi:probable very-long-chain enoyl-CoA reductase art-1 [Cryptotermes secundus]|uniref:probable very-long-chain enoyl-CoA reductase art-1 n=1 Tax=Cryptotermes secundus TaxID=105785 RepID=UPI000CD7DCF7|nr:probable very-long-chain enoyl-CoA reductase art-1 [Cryptotermes secundus]
MEVEILSAQTSKSVGVLNSLAPTTSVRELKKRVHGLKKSLHPDRQALRLELKGRTLKEDESLKSLGLKSGSKLYVKDLGPQIGWKTVFLVEYAGPLLLYLCMYRRPWLFYGEGASSVPIHHAVHIAAGCWTLHYAKRLLETLFVHRFSHATMPIFNLFKNCSYYWLFTLYIAYHINHPLFTAPGSIQVYGSLTAFLLCELGNLSIHIALRNLRPPGTTVRKMPVATLNPFTSLFNLVSCPNYTYEFGSWLAFSVMTQCLPAGLFALAGMYQMTIWALGKHRAYKKEFLSYPRSRKAIVPFLL